MGLDLLDSASSEIIAGREHDWQFGVFQLVCHLGQVGRLSHPVNSHKHYHVGLELFSLLCHLNHQIDLSLGSQDFSESLFHGILDSLPDWSKCFCLRLEQSGSDGVCDMNCHLLSHVFLHKILFELGQNFSEVFLCYFLISNDVLETAYPTTEHAIRSLFLWLLIRVEKSGRVLVLL